MAKELAHATSIRPVPGDLSEVDYDNVENHQFAGQATGDLAYADDATHLRGLAIGSSGQVLVVSGGKPAWSSALSLSGLITFSNATAATNTTTAAVVVSGGIAVAKDSYFGAHVHIQPGATATPYTGYITVDRIDVDEGNTVLGIVSRVAGKMYPFKGDQYNSTGTATVDGWSVITAAHFGSPADGNQAGILFEINDQNLAVISGVRNNGATSGDMVFYTSNAGVLAEKWRIGYQGTLQATGALSITNTTGNLTISPVSDLLVTPTAANSVLGVKVRNTSTGAGAYTTVYCGTSAGTDDVLFAAVGSGNSAYGGARSGVIGTNTTAPMVIIVNGSEVARWSTTTFTENKNVVFSGLATAGAGTALVIDGSNNVIPLASTRAYKMEIESLKQTERLFDLMPRGFVWNEKSSTPGVSDIGLVAEEVWETYPELVELKNGKPYSVKYQQLGVPIIAQMKSLREKILKLEEAVA